MLVVTALPALSTAVIPIIRLDKATLWYSGRVVQGVKTILVGSGPSKREPGNLGTANGGRRFGDFFGALDERCRPGTETKLSGLASDDREISYPPWPVVKEGKL